MKNNIKKPDTKQGKIYYSKKELIIMSVGNQILTLAILLCLVVFGFNYYIASANIDGISMLPTYNTGFVQSRDYQDIAYYTKYANYNRGDVVIPDYIDESGERFLIKRLIAKGGDKVEFISGQLYINSEKIVENYIISNDKNLNMINDNMISKHNGKKKIETWEHITLEKAELNHISFIIEKGYVFYLGDNRGISYDCSSYGPKPENIIKAKVLFVVPYNQTLIQYLWTSFLNIFI